MGQKTHPRGLRLGITETWNSIWYNEKEYAQWLHEDLKIQKFVKQTLSRAGISRVEIERVADRCKITVHTARPGIVIGRRGAEAEKLQADLEKLIGRSVRIEVAEVPRPELDAQLVAETIARQIERRANFRQAMKKSIAASMRAGAQGAKISVSGRLGGHDPSDALENGRRGPPDGSAQDRIQGYLRARPERRCARGRELVPGEAARHDPALPPAKDLSCVRPRGLPPRR